MKALSNAHQIAVDRDLYKRAQAVAEKRGDDIHEVVIQAIERFIASENRDDSFSEHLEPS